MIPSVPTKVHGVGTRTFVTIGNTYNLSYYGKFFNYSHTFKANTRGGYGTIIEEILWYSNGRVDPDKIRSYRALVYMDDGNFMVAGYHALSKIEPPFLFEKELFTLE